MDLALRDLGDFIADTLHKEVTGTEIRLDELMVEAKRDSIVRVLTFLRDDANCKFRQMVDICGVDYPEDAERFEVVYNLLSLSHNRRVRVKVRTTAEVPVPSATGVYSAANWFEREVWDLYGVMFSGHPDLRRIMTDYGFEGHPLRKDFPLTGYVELRYDDEQKRVVYEPVSLPQEFRSYDFLSPWEGVLPGDEKALEADAKGEGEGA
ncbi:MAG: NADH-quinone oxidoreductase subunit C [Rhodobacterales bacterium]|nr:NADH-quinone oxidoreductase subunit C [Rhodobacterales bacterium]